MDKDKVKKQRTQDVYQKKVDAIRKWHERATILSYEIAKINPNTKLPAKKRELKDVEYYINQIKKPKIRV